ncbi:MAG: acetyl-CoA carboxylase biotin carboxylase subunit [Planctomycetes bacterium]|nr:acetyl-CoA carboxylase biotin carboxylase subunit [Planctomycetota bacterium]
MFQRILIANRGEIALRVIRTAREMGIECVTVFSEADAHSLHTRMGHVAVPLGGRLPSESYLVADKILKAAKETGAQAIHPGYGFLSENAAFARAVVDAGLAWIGPPPHAIEVMGDKIESRRAMLAAGVPLVPGLTDPVADADAAVAAAKGIGYPIMIKAAAGGGGKGIRIVRDPGEMKSAFRTASGEAQSAFGDGRLYLERYLDEPRHIEVQVMFDQHGGAVHYGERECSIQRRHQKLLEESPGPIVDAELRAQMGEVALRAGRAVGYQGAGTVEFLYSKGEFFFLEMNTRLQVEHPITEMVTGVDLVRDQLEVAAGRPLARTQDEITWRGHAIEVRINAEDVNAGFLPATGTIRNLRLPGGPWVRVDSCMYRGLEVGLNYDPMLAKIIVWGEDRATAIERMRRALEELNVGGVRTSAPAALAVLAEPAFRAGEYTTHFLEALDLKGRVGAQERLVAAISAVHRRAMASRRALGADAGDRRGWQARSRAALSDHVRLATNPGGQA